MEEISRGCASALFELYSKDQAGLPALVACLLLLESFEHTILALLAGAGEIP